MTEFLSELKTQLISHPEVLIIYSDENVSIVNQYKWEEYVFDCDVNTWTIQWGDTELTINVCEVVNVSYDEDEDTYELKFANGETISISILN